MSEVHWSLHTQRRIFHFHIFSNNDITCILNKLVNTFFILTYVPFNLYNLLYRPTYALAFVGLDNNLVNTNLTLYCTVYANTRSRSLVRQELAFEVWNRTMMNKYYEVYICLRLDTTAVHNSR
jgi:hypothetical protein